MQLVIDLQNRYYEMVKDFDTVNIGRCQYKGVQYQVINAIKNGTPLPKVHGRLIEQPTDAAIAETIGGQNDFADCIREAVATVFENSETIVEANGGAE